MPTDDPEQKRVEEARRKLFEGMYDPGQRRGEPPHVRILNPESLERETDATKSVDGTTRRFAQLEIE